MSHYIAAGLDKSSLREYLNSPDEERAKNIIEAVSMVTGISIDMMKTHSRLRLIVEAKHIAMYLIAINTNIINLKIAQMFGHHEHTCIIYASKCVENLLYTNKKYKKRFGIIKRELGYD